PAIRVRQVLRAAQRSVKPAAAMAVREPVGEPREAEHGPGRGRLRVKALDRDAAVAPEPRPTEYRRRPIHPRREYPPAGAQRVEIVRSANFGEVEVALPGEHPADHVDIWANRLAVANARADVP